MMAAVSMNRCKNVASPRPSCTCRKSAYSKMTPPQSANGIIGRVSLSLLCRAMTAIVQSISAHSRKIQNPTGKNTSGMDIPSGINKYHQYAAPMTGQAKYWMRLSFKYSAIQRRNAASTLQATDVHVLFNCSGIATEVNSTVNDRPLNTSGVLFLLCL